LSQGWPNVRPLLRHTNSSSRRRREVRLLSRGYPSVVGGRRRGRIAADALRTRPRAPRPRLHDAAEPRRHGVDAHGPGGPAARPCQARGLLRRAGTRRGRPDRDRRLRAEPVRQLLPTRVQADHASGGPQPPADHRGRPRRGRQDRRPAAARRPLRLPPGRGVGLVDQVADLPVPAPRAHRRRHPEDHQGLRPSRPAGSRGGLRRRRDHGVRGLSAQPVRRRAHQQTDR